MLADRRSQLFQFGLIEVLPRLTDLWLDPFKRAQENAIGRTLRHFCLWRTARLGSGRWKEGV
jgi:hypothetical protein